MRIVDETHISVSRQDAEEALRLSSEKELIFELPESASIVGTMEECILKKASTQLADMIMDQSDFGRAVDHRHIDFTKAELTDVISYYLHEEHYKDQLDENTYTQKELQNIRNFIIDGLTAVCVDNPMLVYFTFDYIALNIIMYGIFHHKTAATIIEAILYRECLDTRVFDLESIGIAQVTAIANTPYEEYPAGAPYPLID